MPECHSTNTVALDLCHRESAPEGTVIVTDCQTAGRGQRGNTWESEPGANLTFSAILKPTFLAIADQFAVSMVTSLALQDYLGKELGPNATPLIKWPNDILVNEFKIAGILIESQVAGQQFNNMVVGIGLNVNQTGFSLARATSMLNVSGSNFVLEEVLHAVLKHLEVRYLQLRAGEMKKIREDYLARLFRYDQEQRFVSAEKEFDGRISGVDREGRLLVIAAGKELAFGIKEIAFAE